MDLGAGDVIAGKYRIERVLGRGGMGTVVAATHLELGELRAIKLLRPDLDAGSSSSARLMREAQVAARLRSDHVARVYDAERLPDGTPFVVMEHLEGQDLSALRKQGVVPSIEDACRYVIEVCDALAEAHGLGLVHRDIKLGNLMLVPGRPPRIKVLDFGIAKSASHEGETLTETGQILGTPAFMAPEQMTGAPDVDARADIWSLGVVLYVLLTGAYPYGSTDALALVSRIVALKERPAPLSQKRPDVPPALEAVVLRCLSREREDRPATAAELAHALAPFGGEEGRRVAARLGGGASRGGESPEPRPPVRRFRLAGVAALFTLAGGLAALLLARGGAEEPAQASVIATADVQTIQQPPVTADSASPAAEAAPPPLAAAVASAPRRPEPRIAGTSHGSPSATKRHDGEPGRGSPNPSGGRDGEPRGGSPNPSDRSTLPNRHSF